MRKFIKNWWFTVLCYAIALSIFAFVIAGIILINYNDIDYFYTFVLRLLIINSCSPIILLVILGESTAPQKQTETK